MATTAPPDGNASGTSEETVNSVFLDLKFRMARSNKMIKKLIQETKAGVDTPKNRELISEAATLWKKFQALKSGIRGIGDRFITDFLKLSPRETLIALKGLEKGNLKALFFAINGFPSKFVELEEKIRSFILSYGISENFAWIAYIRLRLKVQKDCFEAKTEFLQNVEGNEEEMVLLKEKSEALISKLKEFGWMSGEFLRDFLQREMRDIGEESGRLVKERLGVGADHLEKRLREFQNAVNIPWDRYIYLSCEEGVEFGEKIRAFDETLDKIEYKVFLTSSELDEAKKKQNTTVPASGTGEYLRNEPNPTDGNLSGAKEDDSSSSKKRKT